MTTIGWALTALGCAAIPTLLVVHARHTTEVAEDSVAPSRPAPSPPIQHDGDGDDGSEKRVT